VLGESERVSITLRSSGDIPNRKGSAHGRDDTGSYVTQSYRVITRSERAGVAVDSTCSNKLELEISMGLGKSKGK